MAFTKHPKYLLKMSTYGFRTYSHSVQRIVNNVLGENAKVTAVQANEDSVYVYARRGSSGSIIRPRSDEAKLIRKKLVARMGAGIVNSVFNRALLAA
jgi:hypothetical protein